MVVYTRFAPLKFALRANKAMTILSSVLEHMGYTTSALGGIPRGLRHPRDAPSGLGRYIPIPIRDSPPSSIVTIHHSELQRGPPVHREELEEAREGDQG